MTTVTSRFRAAYNAFWNPPAGDSEGFASQRMSRYEWFWALYWNTAYDDLSAYFANYPTGSKLYKFTRGLRNPVHRYVDFYVANVWGGALDMQAGNGRATPSALPIETENEALRPAIARLWTWSNWNSKRTLATRFSSSLGDCFIKVVDRPQVGKVYLQVRWPGEVSEAEWDDFGNLKRAVIEYDSLDEKEQRFTYREEIEHPSAWGGATTRFSTYRNGIAFGYAENGGEAQWTTPYDFVPMVHVPWLDVGQHWGAVGFIAAVRKIDAANALASQLADQVGKAVHTPLVAMGIQAGDVTVSQSDQDSIPIMYVNRTPGEADISPLISDLNLEHGLNLLNAQLHEIHEDLPEMRMSEALRSGMSGEALGRAFSDVLAQIEQVRAGHDSALVRAQMMAVAIAGQSRYHPDFAGFDLNSYAQGRLDHNIGRRPVLPRSSDEELKAQQVRWEMVNKAVGSGVPMATALREIMGWQEEQFAGMAEDAEAEESQRAELGAVMLEEARRRFDGGMAPTPGPSPALTPGPSPTGRGGNGTGRGG